MSTTIDNTQLASALAELQSLFSSASVKDTGKIISGDMPDAAGTSGLPSTDSLPVLTPPTVGGGMSLETLLQALGEEVRRQTCRDGVASLELKAEQQDEINQKELEEMKKRLEEMKSKSILNGFLKAFKIIGVIIGAVASVASIVGGAMTGNPLLVAAGIAGLVMTADSVLSLASDGKYSIAAGFTELGKAMGMSDDAAQWFGFAMNLTVMLAGIGLSVAGAASAATSAAANATSTLTKVLNTTSQVANVASAVNTTATGAATIGGAVIDYNIGKSQAASKELEAVLERLRQAIEMDKDMVEAEMERANTLMEQVKDIVDGTIETQTAVLSANPGIA